MRRPVSLVARQNVTYRLPVTLVNAFKLAAGSMGKCQLQVIEELLEDYIATVKEIDKNAHD